MDGLPSPVTIKLDTDLLKTDLDGTLALGDNAEFDFKFDGEIPSAAELADAFQIKALPARGVLGKLSLVGSGLGLLRRHHAEDRGRDAMRVRC